MGECRRSPVENDEDEATEGIVSIVQFTPSAVSSIFFASDSG